MRKRYTAATSRSSRALLAAILLITACTNAHAAQPDVKGQLKNFYLPTGAAVKEVSVTTRGEAEAEIFVLTEAVAIKETGPKETVAKFGEVYAWLPNFIAVNRDTPTKLTFWNLQPDDEHDFMLADPQGNVLMHVKLLPLTKTSWVFTFHHEGIFNFYCAVHQPEMNGQILVLPPARK